MREWWHGRCGGLYYSFVMRPVSNEAVSDRARHPIKTRHPAKAGIQAFTQDGESAGDRPPAKLQPLHLRQLP